MARFTRIILIDDEDQGVREFAISHRMVWLLGILGLLLAAALLAVFMSYGRVYVKSRRVASLEQVLAASRVEAAGLDSLRAEIDAMAGLQEQLLLMLGVETLPTDSTLATTGSSLENLADAVATPPPDAWPAAGFTTREYTEGRPAEGTREHLGLDIAGPEGAPILAAGDGVVVRSGTDRYLGNFVEIQHGMGYLTVYGHCQQVAVARGSPVRRGQVIGYVGATGEATAPHLHFELWHHGEAVNPRQFLQGEPPAP